MVVAVCDVDESRLEWFADRVVPRDSLYTDVDELLARDDVDAVYCAVPHNLHEELYVKILRAGKHLFAEKPFGIDAAAAREDRGGRRRVAGAARPLLERVPVLARRAANLRGRASRTLRRRDRGARGVPAQQRPGSEQADQLEAHGRRQRPLRGVLGDLGLHVLHLPLRLGWRPEIVFAVLSNIVRERPNASGELVPCETWTTRSSRAASAPASRCGSR